MCVRPGAHVLAISADTLQVAFANYTATFNSPPVVKAATALLELLREPTPREDAIRDAAVATQLKEPLVRYVLETLARSRCLLELPPGSPVHEDPLDTFHGYMAEDPAALRADLAAARPLLIHFGDAAAEAPQRARASGLDGVTDLLIEPGTPCHELLDEIGARLDDASMLAVWGLPYRLGLTASLNELAIERGRPVLFGACEGFVGRVGPYVIPSNTACLECAQSRMLSNAGAPELRALPAYRARHRDIVPEPWPTHPVFAEAVLSQFVLELTRITGRLGAQTIGGLLEYRFGDGCAERHTVLRVPRCPACHPARPPRLPWDAVFPAPTVKNAV